MYATKQPLDTRGKVVRGHFSTVYACTDQGYEYAIKSRKAPNLTELLHEKKFWSTNIQTSQTNTGRKKFLAPGSALCVVPVTARSCKSSLYCGGLRKKTSSSSYREFWVSMCPACKKDESPPYHEWNMWLYVIFIGNIGNTWTHLN